MSKIVNAYVVYDLDDWPKILLHNFALNNWVFGATNKAKDSNKISIYKMAMK